MIIWVRNLVLIVLVLSVIYAVLSICGHYKARKRLQVNYDAKAEKSEPKEVYIAKGLKAYDKSLRPKLFLFVFIVPIVIIGTLIYLAQSS